MGVKIGVGTKLPRAPAVFERKRKWSLPEQRVEEAKHFKNGVDGPIKPPDKAFEENYTNARKFEAAVAKQLDLQTRKGWLVVSVSEEATGST